MERAAVTHLEERHGAGIEVLLGVDVLAVEVVDSRIELGEAVGEEEEHRLLECAGAVVGESDLERTLDLRFGGHDAGIEPVLRAQEDRCGSGAHGEQTDGEDGRCELDEGVTGDR